MAPRAPRAERRDREGADGQRENHSCRHHPPLQIRSPPGLDAFTSSSSCS
jgi:hypothetical protein